MDLINLSNNGFSLNKYQILKQLPAKYILSNREIKYSNEYISSNTYYDRISTLQVKYSINQLQKVFSNKIAMQIAKQTIVIINQTKSNSSNSNIAITTEKSSKSNSNIHNSIVSDINEETNTQNDNRSNPFSNHKNNFNSESDNSGKKIFSELGKTKEKNYLFFESGILHFLFVASLVVLIVYFKKYRGLNQPKIKSFKEDELDAMNAVNNILAKGNNKYKKRIDKNDKNDKSASNNSDSNTDKRSLQYDLINRTKKKAKKE